MSTTDVLLRVEQHHVTMADVDAAGFLFYTAPYVWRERIFTHWLTEVGRPLSSLILAGSVPPVVASSCRYLSPLRLDDIVELRLFCSRMGYTSFDIRCDVVRLDGLLTNDVTTTQVWTAEDDEGAMHSSPVPNWMRLLLGTSSAS